MKYVIRLCIKATATLTVIIAGYYYVDSILFDGVEPKSINESGIKGTFFSKDKIEKQTTILLIGGGDWGEYWGQELAKANFVGLSLPYHREEGLPKLPEEIPLEYFAKAIDWVKEQPQVNPNKIIVMGASRNAELALLIASHYPDRVHGVITFSPSSVSWSNTVLPFNSDIIKPSWTFKNLPVSYIPMAKIKGGESDTIETLSYWTEALTDSNAVNMASIQVENIRGPILVFSGVDDKVWPSAMMSEMIENRIKHNNFAFEFDNIKYENAGHQISGNPNNPYSIRYGEMTIDQKKYIFEFGGTENGDIAAQNDAFVRVINFLSKI